MKNGKMNVELECVSPLTSPGDKHSLTIRMDVETQFVPFGIAAQRFGVPKSWLREEIAKGAIPFLLIGRTMLVNIPLVAATLIARSYWEKGIASKKLLNGNT